MSRRNPKRVGICAHCRKSPAHRPRGLCFNCYATPAVRAIYPAVPPQVSGAIGGRTPKRRAAA